MKRLKYISAFALLALMGLWSCSSDLQTANSSASHGKGHKVSLTIGSNAKTRTAAPTSLGGFDREKAIDGDKLYAVVFDQQGKFFETIKITDYNSGDGTCSFTLSDAGVYYGYIIANTSKGTALTGLTAGTSTEDDLFNIIEDTDPGTNLAASTNFLMTSKRTLLDVDGDADTALGTVTLTRAVARIDIDVTAVDGLAITEVKVENRYKKSLIIRGNNPDDTSLGAATPTDTKTYTRGTSAGQVDALSDGTGLVNDQQWQGVIYGYENINTNTVVTITHTLNGVASQTIVDFDDANSGAGQAIKRNNIYTVKLTNEALTPTLQDINYAITVVDWDNSVNLAYTDLTDHEKPDYKVTSNHVTSDYTDDVNELNPGKVIAKKTDSPTEITLQITSHGKVASEVSFVDKNGSAYDFLGDAVGGVIEQVGATTYGADGSIIQNYKITIPQTIVTSLNGGDYFTFKVHNVFDDTATGSRSFRVTPLDPKWNPLWWVAKTNVKSVSGSIVTFEENENSAGSRTAYSYAYALSHFSKNGQSYDGYETVGLTDGVSAVGWHLPTLKEMYSIMPLAGSPTIFSNTTLTVGGIYESSSVASRFGYSSETRNTDITEVSYWSAINGNIRYAIRFIGTDYCSVWKYDMTDSRYLKINSKLIDKVEKTELTRLSEIMNEISDNDGDGIAYDWAEDEENGSIERIFWCCGDTYAATDGGAMTHNIDANGWYWTATTGNSIGNTILCDLCVGQSNHVYVHTSSSYSYNHGFTVRLFRDGE